MASPVADDSATNSGYPDPMATQTPAPPSDAYPVQIPSPSSPAAAYPAPVTLAPDDVTETVFLPLVNEDGTAVTPTPAPPTVTPIPIVDFTAVRSDLNAQGQELVYSKIGLHTTFAEDKALIEAWMRQLDAAGVPFVLKSVDNAEPLFVAQQLMAESDVPHVLIYRASGGVPNYELPPREAARQHWQFHVEKFPPELDRSRLWIETINEPDRRRSEWLAEFALETAALAMADGFRWAAFGWAPGEPEPENWQGPKMLEFLRLVGENPDRLAIAVHEYSGIVDEIALEYPFRVGRFLDLFTIADQNGFSRPTVLVSEFGWAYDDIPPIEQALSHIDWAAELYASFPQIKGAAVWNLGVGCCFADISEQVQELVEPLALFNLTNYYVRPLSPAQAPTDPALYAP